MFKYLEVFWSVFILENLEHVHHFRGSIYPSVQRKMQTTILTETLPLGMNEMIRSTIPGRLLTSLGRFSK